MNADSGQRQLFRAYLTNAPAAYAMAFGSLAAFTLGAWQSNPAIMLGGPAAIVLGVAGVAWYCADRAAAKRVLLAPAARSEQRSHRHQVGATGVGEPDRARELEAAGWGCVADLDPSPAPRTVRAVLEVARAGARADGGGLVSWLANHPLAPGFELKAGTLCVFVPPGA